MIMRYKYMANTILMSLILVGCNGSGGSGSGSSLPINNIPSSFQCLPSQLPSVSSSSMNIKIAYAESCAVSAAPESVTLQSMAVALDGYKYTGDSYINYCTATPLKYNPSTGVGFVLTAAHCVTSGTKAANTPINQNNIYSSLYAPYANTGHNSAWIVQQTTAGPINESSGLTAQIVAAYVYSQYCQVPSFESGTCSNITLANGDFAVLKVQTESGTTLAVNNSVALAPSDLVLDSFSYILGLGYGTTNPNGSFGSINPSNPYLYYMNYQYFGTNSYQNFAGESVILTGYNYDNTYYSIVCPGDSGGGDFVWNGNGWYLVGVHSFISTAIQLCGAASTYYSNVGNAAADVRQFNSWIQNVLTNDTESTGCANLGANYVCQDGNGT